MATERGFETVKSYADLEADAHAKWRQMAKIKAEEQAALHAYLSQQPDVKDAPAFGSQWANEMVICVCGGHVYTMRRWACVNGKRYRTEIDCILCGRRNTWDFQEARWLGR